MKPDLKYYHFSSILQKEGWLSSAYVGVDENGIIQYLENAAPAEGAAIEAVQGFALPGFQNAHSHAFQYAMAGLAENHPPEPRMIFGHGAKRCINVHYP